MTRLPGPGAARLLPLALAAAILGIATSCSKKGSGSDIGPYLPKPPSHAYTVTVVDQDGRPVTAARGTLGGVVAASDRSGRLEFANQPSGRLVLDVSGSAASATGPEAFPGLVLQADVGGGSGERAIPLVLPDLNGGTTRQVELGVQIADQALALGATTLTIRAGSNVTYPGGSSPVDVTLVTLAREDLPAPLPASASGGWMSGRGFLVHPPELGIVPGADLEAPNDLGMTPSQTARLFRLVAASGTWEDAGSGALDPGGSIRSAGVTGGGLYCFAIPVARLTTATGRVKLPTGAPVRGALVTGPGGLATIADGSGVYFLAGLPAVDASGADVSYPISMTAPTGYRFARVKAVVVPVEGSFTVPDQTLESFETGTLQVLSLFRGRIDALREVRVSSDLGGTAGLVVSDAGGVAIFRDMETGLYGARFDYALGQDVARGDSRVKLESRSDVMDVKVIAVEGDPREANALDFGTIFAGDETGRGPVQGAVVMEGVVFPPRDLGTTPDHGALSGTDIHLKNVTVAAGTKRDGIDVVSNYTAVRVDNIRIEAPVLRAIVTPGGPFVPHGLLSGTITGSAGGGKTRRMRSFGPVLESAWRAAVMGGTSLAAPVPRKLDPEVTGLLAFRTGVPLGPHTSVVAEEGTLSGSAFTLESVGVAFPSAVSGVEAFADIDLSVRLLSRLVLPGVAASLDPRIPDSALRLDLGVSLGNRRALDIGRQLAGNVARAGDDLSLTVPMVDALGGVGHLAWVSGEASTAGVTVRQGSLVAAPSVSLPAGFLAAPSFVSPLPGAVVPSAGFQVQWTVPAGTSFQILELLASTGTEVRKWTVLLPPDTGSFDFFRLLDSAPKALAAGKTYRLTLTCHRLTEGFAVGRFDEYQRILGTMLGPSRPEQGVTAVSSVAIVVTTS